MARPLQHTAQAAADAAAFLARWEAIAARVDAAEGAAEAEGAAAADRTKARYGALLEAAKSLTGLPEERRTVDARVAGCTAQVWVTCALDADTNTLSFAADSDSALSRGLAALLVEAFDGLTVEEALAADAKALAALGLGASSLTASRANGLLNMFEAFRRRARGAAERAAPGSGPFPSLVVTREGIEARGDFARAQAEFMRPDAARASEMASLLRDKRVGVVAHYYMDPEVQGVLSAARKEWRHVHISDSLLMADQAVVMAEDGCKAIAVLGVDFMAENVRAVLDRAGHTDVPVYRMAAEDIGCSLADAARDVAYDEYLKEAAATPKSVHVVYINTALTTKARANALVPTITCTSSNVVRTVLQAFAQVPGASVFYGPDSYMGANLVEMLEGVLVLPDEEVKRLHPEHTKDTIRDALTRLRFYDEGMCVVHDMFGADVVRTVRDYYADAHLTAHFEVPGGLFGLALEARQRGMGVVGSTAEILSFIKTKTQAAIELGVESGAGSAERLTFVLGTEVGMVTSIVLAVQAMLRAQPEGAADVQVEIVFPVSSDAITQVGGGGRAGEQGLSADADSSGKAYPQLMGLEVVPGAAGGEGCSAEGGCASCPYMKMNSLTALMRVLEAVGTDEGTRTLARLHTKHALA